MVLPGPMREYLIPRWKTRLRPVWAIRFYVYVIF